DGIRDFHVTGVQTCALPICFPKNHILRKRLGPGYHDFLSGEKAHIYGKYVFHSVVDPEKMDSVEVFFDADNANLLLAGYNIQYLVMMIFNCFAMQRMFVTTEEFKLNGYKNQKSKQLFHLQYTDNDGKLMPYNATEYYIALRIRGGHIDVPLNLFKHHELASAAVQEFTLDCRVMPTYIDISFDLSPIVLGFPTSLLDSQVREHKRQTYLGMESMKF